MSMVNLKPLLTKILASLTPDSTWGSDKVARYRKVGRVATITWSGVNTDVAITGDGSTWDNVATIPPDYWPTTTIYTVGIMRGVTPVRVRVTSSGNLDVLSNTAISAVASLVFNLTYVI